MASVFAGSEIVELGVQIEKNGKDFYDILVKKTKNEKAKGIFNYLASEEDSHIITFQKILGSVQKYEPKEAYPQDYFAHMNSLANAHIFTKKNKGEEIAKKTKTDIEAIEIAIGFERDSILFYEGMKKVVPESDRNTIDALIKEEQKHLERLSEFKKYL